MEEGDGSLDVKPTSNSPAKDCERSEGDEEEDKAQSNIAVLVSHPDTTTHINNFAEDLLGHLKAGDASKVCESYQTLSEVEDIDNGKRTCYILFTKTFDIMMEVVKNGDSETMLKYYVWHLLQLMTCCPQIKEVLYPDHESVSLLLTFNSTHNWDADQKSSLKSITLNYVLIMLSNADDEYYEMVETTPLFTFLHDTLTSCTMDTSDPHFELTLLTLNLLLEGSSGCKRKLLEHDFKTLISLKMEQRGERCHDNMLHVTKQTLDKFLLLTSDSKSFVETFRYNAKQEIDKDSWFGDKSCFNTSCTSGKQCSGDATGLNLKYCSRCKSVTYCSKECQIAHWKAGHSKVCKKKLP